MPIVRGGVMNERRGRRWSAAEVSLLLQLASENLPGSEIAARMSRSYAGVQEKAWSLGARIGKPRRLRTAWTSADDAWVAQLARAGITRRAAAALMGRDVGTVRRRLKTLGLSWQYPPRPPRRPPAPVPPRRDWQEVAAQLKWFAKHGWSVGMAALELDIDTSRAWRLSRDFGIQWQVRFRSTRGATPPPELGHGRLEAQRSWEWHPPRGSKPRGFPTRH
jgi:hypothetical protein